MLSRFVGFQHLFLLNVCSMGNQTIAGHRPSIQIGDLLRQISAAADMPSVQARASIRLCPVNNFVSVNFTLSGELTVFRNQTVGRFYDPATGRVPLTTVIGLTARLKPLGMRLA
jgi:hypothetical protein